MERAEGPPVPCTLSPLETKPPLGGGVLPGGGRPQRVLPEPAVCGENRCAFLQGLLTVAPKEGQDGLPAPEHN